MNPRDNDNFRHIERNAYDRIREIQRNADTAEQHIRAMLSRIETTTERYYKHGMCVIPDFLRGHWGTASYVSGSARGYFKELSTLWQRPFVCAERHIVSSRVSEWWEISLPKNKRSDKLAVSLMLAAAETTVFSGGGTGHMLDYDTIYQDSTNGTWKFYVHDNNYSFVEQYERHCATDPICRIILNLACIPRP